MRNHLNERERRMIEKVGNAIYHARFIHPGARLIVTGVSVAYVIKQTAIAVQLVKNAEGA